MSLSAAASPAWLCAWQLRKRGLPVILLERSERFGGVIDSADYDGFHFDVGPQSFSATEPLTELIDELNLAGEVLRADPRAPRYILLGGKLVRVPTGPGGFLATPLVGWGTKLRILREPLRHTRPPEGDESIASFVRRKFGEDLLTNLVAPFVSGVYAGEPEKLSLNSAFPGIRQLEERFGSVIRGAMKSRRKGGGPRPSLCNFKNGMAALTGALAHRLGSGAIAGAEVTAVRRRAAAGTSGASGEAGFQVSYNAGGVTASVEASAIVVATPADAAGQILRAIEPRFAEALARIAYASVAQVCTGYRLTQLSGSRDAGRGNSSKMRQAGQATTTVTNAPSGFGFLVPRTEGSRILGTVWNSSLFPSLLPASVPTSTRAPVGALGPGQVSGGDADVAADRVSFTSFLGGATDPEICQRSDDEIAGIVQQELASIMGISGAPVATHVTRWARALPQYNLGHAQVVTELRELCTMTPGVFLTGNYLRGPSLGACVEEAGSTAESVAVFMRGTG